MTQRALHRCPYDGVNRPFVFELDLGLGRMDVHIDLSRIDFEVQPIGGIRFPGKEGLKGIRDRMVEVTVLDETTVDKEILLSAGLTRKLGLTNKTLNVQEGGSS